MVKILREADHTPVVEVAKKHGIMIKRFALGARSSAGLSRRTCGACASSSKRIIGSRSLLPNAIWKLK
jgi:hypothetical protein